MSIKTDMLIVGIPSAKSLTDAGVSLTVNQCKALKLSRALGVLTRGLQGLIMAYGIVYSLRGDFSALLVAVLLSWAINSAKPRMPDSVLAAIDAHIAENSKEVKP